jgi:aspartate aminotransferase
MNCSTRLTKVPASPIRKLVPFAQDAKKRGIHVYHLNIGDPDIKTPDVMLNVLLQWKKNPIGYDLSQGNPAFLSALTSYYHGVGFPFIAEKNIQVTSGGSEAIFMALFATCNPGDEVIFFEPLYANYNSFAVTTGVTLVPIETTIKQGFHLPTKEQIEKHITEKTKAILYCSPNNPTGTVYTKNEIDMLVSLAKKHDLFLLSDEAYREFTYDGIKHVSLCLYMKDMPDKAILLDSLSKRYSICGARLGCLVSLNEDVLAGVLRIAQGRLSSGLIDQTMAAELTHVPSSYFKEVNTEYQKRRDILVSGLQNIAGVTVTKPEGAFYVIVSLPVSSAEDFCQWLLTDFSDKNETVMIAPANGFYATPDLGVNQVRIAYVLNQQSLSRAIELLKKALTMYTHSSINKRSQ